MRAAKGVTHADSAFSASISSARLGPVRAPSRGVRTAGRAAMAGKASAQPITARCSGRGAGGAASPRRPGLEPPSLHSSAPGTVRPLVHGQEGSPWLCVFRRPRLGSSPAQLLGSSGLKQGDLGPSSPPAATGPHPCLHRDPSDRKHAGPRSLRSHLPCQDGPRGQHPASLRRGSCRPGEPGRPLGPPSSPLPSATRELSFTGRGLEASRSP